MNYVGTELPNFQHATNWKNYFAKFIRPFLSGHILEVGAGIGGTTLILNKGTEKSWLCVEPDPTLYNELAKKIKSNEIPSNCTVTKNTLRELDSSIKYDAILYIDVLEHIQEDKKELEYAENLLARKGHLIVLAPAHQFLYSPFDKALGHYRRYNKKMLKNISPPGLTLLSLRYLDSLGFFGSALNKVVLKQSSPTLNQIKAWDKILIPLSKFTDFIIGYNAGKTILGIWQKTS